MAEGGRVTCNFFQSMNGGGRGGGEGSNTKVYFGIGAFPPIVIAKSLINMSNMHKMLGTFCRFFFRSGSILQFIRLDNFIPSRPTKQRWFNEKVLAPKVNVMV